MTDLETLVANAHTAFAAAVTPADLENAKALFLGKTGRVTELMKGMAALSVDEKKSRGAAVNLCKQAIEAALNARRQALSDAELEKQLKAEALDVSLPGRQRSQGGLHPVSLTLERIEGIFSSMGFDVAQGPEIKPIGSTSPPSTPLKTILQGRCTIRFTSKAALRRRRICCVPIPARCKSVMRCSMLKSTVR